MSKKSLLSQLPRPMLKKAINVLENALEENERETSRNERTEKLSTNEAAARFNLSQRLIDINILIIKELETGNEFILKKSKKVMR